MISNKAKAKYKQILGHRYTTTVISYLNKKELTNSNGSIFSSAHIRNVMNGSTSHAVLEDAILAVYKLELKKQEEKKKLLGS